MGRGDYLVQDLRCTEEETVNGLCLPRKNVLIQILSPFPNRKILLRYNFSQMLLLSQGCFSLPCYLYSTKYFELPQCTTTTIMFSFVYICSDHLDCKCRKREMVFCHLTNEDSTCYIVRT